MRPGSLNAEHYVSIRNSLNYLTLEMATQDGDRVYAIDQETAALVDGTASFALSSGSIDVLDERMTITVSGETVSTPIARISREDYLMIPDKTTQGMPSQFTVDHSVLNTPTVQLWPVSDAAYTVTYDRMRFIQDSVALSDTADVRRIWLDALVAGLAKRIAQKWNLERFDKCALEYDRAYAIAKMECRGRDAIMMYGRGFGWSRRRRA